jgi:tripartite ATP-independent transporter DctM subunit
MATGGIAMLIPPSALAVLLASLAERPIAALLIAGIVPGIMMSVLFIGYVVGRCAMTPGLAPSYDVEEFGFAERWTPFLIYVMPLFAIFMVVVGSIFMHLASPTESAALCCVATTVACLGYRALTWRNLVKSVMETAKITTMILFIIAGSLTFSQILAVSGAVDGLLAEITALQLTPLLAIVFMMAVLLFLGAFMDQVSMLLLTLPFFLPLAAAQGIDMLWLLVLMLIVMEISLLTPPFGLLLFVMKGVAPFKTTLLQIYGAAAPFVVLELIVLALLIAFPATALWLPRLIG